MPNEDNACIRYLMKEMDPSEEVLMERAMMEDEDLLIEVECMRQTLDRLNGLPEKKPPSELTEKIVRQAASEARNRHRLLPGLITYSTVTRMVAATLLVTALLMGGLLVYNDITAENSGQSEAAQRSGISSPALNATPAGAENIEPWIDRNNVIHFQDQFSDENRAAFDSILNQSTRKLRPIDEPLFYNTRTNSLQLTGAGR